MQLAFVQFSPEWEKINQNLSFVSEKISGLPAEVDLVVLPEMFTTGFTMQPQQVAEVEKGRTLQTLQQLAQQKQVAITGSWVTEENGKYYNRLYFVFPDGSYQTYNKRHLFTLAGEEKVYEPGQEKLIVSYKGWNICPLVCYDLRFPVYARIVDQSYDLLLYVASWPDKRIYAWDSLLKARAIENMSYVVGVNRCGVDHQELHYSGHSQAIDYMGQPLTDVEIGESITIVVLDKALQNQARAKFAFLQDADAFHLVR